MNDLGSTENSCPKCEKRKKIRTLIAYWLLGLCNNYGYVVMLAAAADIIKKFSDKNEQSKVRDCTYMSTGVVLLADVLPCLLVKIIGPFLPFFVHVRVALIIVLASASFILVAFSESMPLAILGVVLTSFSSGLGEITYLQYSSFYDKNVVSTWSSGTGGAGVFGALSYVLLNAIGLRNALLAMLVVPLAMGLSFWYLLPKPSEFDVHNVSDNKDDIPTQSLRTKLGLLPGLAKYMVPLGLVYLFEYFINQGLFELINFNNAVVDKEAQYRWLQVTYQLGVLMSRSSVNLFHIKRVYILAILQLVNVALYTTEVIYFYVPSFYIVIALTLWEGLLGGSAYVNTFYTISAEVPEENKQFSMAMTSFADSCGITLAGIFSMLAHNKICDIPLPNHVY
ncbi:unnamed protein product [Brassicogethes aeneus]|uniref:Battenin n=1 Tax=Brassicogethes aeneus TaxID=1431903 RepID=A0A9P0BFN4_BRAAE|nr:unnamed protein product [Brassicogethes aeneus]